MKRIVTLTTIATIGAIAFACAGCSKKSDADSALNNAVKAMAEPAPSAPPPAPAVAPAPAQPAPQAAPKVEVSQQMNQAVAAYKSGNYEDAVSKLQWLRAQKGTTPQQLTALQEATDAVMGEIYARAQKGDARAVAAVKQYEALQNANRN